MNINQVSESSNQAEVKVIPVEDLYHTYQLLTEETSQCCKELKMIICQQMRLNSTSNFEIQCQYDIGIENIKEVIQFINKDLNKLKSLLTLCFSHKQSNPREDQNEGRILRICMIAKQMSLLLKDAEQQTQKNQNQYIMGNLCSMIKIFNEAIFSYESNNYENQQIINQIFKKVPKLNQQIWLQNYQNSAASSDYTNEEETILQKFQYEMELLRREYAMKKQRFEEELTNLARQNSLLEESLRMKVQQLQKNEAEFIVYLKKYNSYIQKQKDEIDELWHHIQNLQEENKSKIKFQKDLSLLEETGEIKQKEKQTKQNNIIHEIQELSKFEKTSKTTKAPASTRENVKKMIQKSN